jgi:hypothetical protein
MKKKIKVLSFLFLFFSITPVFAGSTEKLFVEPTHDISQRKRIDANLELVTNYIYFYFDSSWWDNLEEEKREEYRDIVYNLGSEFENKIYPEIKKDFGEVPKHNVVGNSDRISVLFHPMESRSGGYFRTGDQYSIYQYPQSNEKNILYLNTHLIEDPDIAGYLAHEYIHLITFNEKNKKHDVDEEIWLNELRAEAIISILGYNDDYQGSNLQKRIKNFLYDPDISLTEWTDQVADYGVINIFAQYLLDHYGKEILIDSLKSELVGIKSIEYALSKKEEEKTFSELFTDFKIAVYLNDCSYGEYYCFKNENLKDVSVYPATVFITTRDEGFHEISYQTKDWAGNWFRFVGGSGTFNLNFFGEGKFIVPYILCQKNKECSVHFLKIDKENKGELVIENFNSVYESITIIPSLQQKFSGFNGAEKTKQLIMEVEIEEISEVSEIDVKKMQERVLFLAMKMKEIYASLGRGIPKSNKRIEKDLYYGMFNSDEVRKLQNFLKDQGEDIYPEKLVTGNFYHLTKQAVIRFQEAYREKILQPLGLVEGTGYVGENTRRLINSFLRK